MKYLKINDMYSKKLEKLIEYALADGVLTEKERQALMKAAEAEGVDLGEFEVVLEARLHEKTRKRERNLIADKQDESDEQFDSVEKGLKQKLTDFRSSNPLLWKVILYSVIAVAGLILLRVILVWFLPYLITVVVLGIALYIGIMYVKRKKTDENK
jgi:Flp pilus assembly protein TadB